MRVLLVEPQYRRKLSKPPTSYKNRKEDSTLWYPPIGLMKLARFHKDRGDEVRFVSGCDPTAFSEGDLFKPEELWDRVYITTLFTYDLLKIVKTIRFYLNAVGGTIGKIYVGGIMASLLPDAIFEETGVYPISGVLNSPEQIHLSGNTNIDLLPPDYDLLDPTYYAINDTFYAYTTKGCTNNCPWCGVPKIEPEYIPYIDIKPTIRKLRELYGDKSTLKLMDNNLLASPMLKKIVKDLLDLGYGRGQTTNTKPPKKRVIDFNQGLDASHLNEQNMKLLAQLNVRPMRIAFDRLRGKNDYIRALKLANNYGVEEFSNYMLYNYHDTPRDLYKRLSINIELNEKWLKKSPARVSGKIYSYPMRYAPIDDKDGNDASKNRDLITYKKYGARDWLKNPVWTKRFMRNIEIMKGAAHGAISPTPTLARRTIGQTFEEFIANLYMPEELLRNRNKHEKRIYEQEPSREPGTGLVEEFRFFIIELLNKCNKRFKLFHEAVSPNSSTLIQKILQEIDDTEIKEWLKWYLIRK